MVRGLLFVLLISAVSASRTSEASGGLDRASVPGLALGALNPRDDQNDKALLITQDQLFIVV